MPMRAILGIGLLALVTGTAPPATAAGFNDPDWPCVQRKVSRLSWGTIWTGPPLPEKPAWRDEALLARAVPAITARRTTMEEVEVLVSEIAEAAGDRREELLVRLFAGVFYEIDAERSRLIDGIGNYAQNQRQLSERIDGLRSEIGALRETTAKTDYDGLDRIEEFEDKVRWDTKIFEKRRRALTYVCESPVILEKRAFAVARIVAAALKAE